MSIYRSKFEASIAEQLRRAGVTFEYESKVLRYSKPVTPSRYTPDFILPNGIIVETKGLFTAADRKKHLLVRDQHSELDIRFVFQRAMNRLYKGSKTTYADWCMENGFKYATGQIPAEWLLP